MDTMCVGERRVVELTVPDDVRAAIADDAAVVLRDAAGNVYARIVPEPARDPNGPIIPWEPNVTREELDRRDAQPGFTFDEVKKRLGWE